MVLEKNVKRHLDIVTKLYYQDDQVIERNKLKKFLSVSNQTLLSDIKEINRLANKELITGDSKTIQLNLAHDDGLKKICRLILRTSTVVLYFYEVTIHHLTLTEIYNEVFMSESMEYRTRKSWNDHFLDKGYSVEFVFNNDTKKIDLVGDEDTLRSLMRYMLYEYMMEDIYDNIQYNNVIKDVAKIVKQKGLGYTSTQVDLISGALFVSLLRVSQGYRRKIKADIGTKRLYKWLLNEKQVIKNIKKNFGVVITIDLLSDVTGGKVLEVVNMISRKKSGIFTSSRNPIKKLVKSFSLKTYGREILLEEKEIDQLQGILDFASYQVSSFIYNPHQMLWEELALEEEKEFFLQELVHFKLFSALPNEEKMVEFYFYLTSILSFYNYTSTSKKKILILSRHPTFYQKRIHSFIKDRYGNFISVEIYEGDIYSLHIDKTEKFDIIISEFGLPYGKSKQIYLPEVITVKFIKDVDASIFQI